MTPLQTAQLRQSETRSAIAAILEKPERSDDDRAELSKLTTRAQEFEIEIRAALVSETEIDTPVANDTPEGRELRSLFGRVDVDDYFNEILTGKPADAPARELRSALLGDDVGAGYLPLDLLLDLETRADAISTVSAPIQASQQTIAGRVFATGAAAYMGVSFPSVPVGTVAYPRISSGTTADVRSEGVELDGMAAALTTETANPVGLTASYTIPTEATYRIQGYQGALRADMQGVLSEKLDALALNGQAAVQDTSPEIDGIIRSLADPTNPTATATALDFLDAYTSSVDGRHADSDAAVRLLTNAACYRYAYGLQLETSGELLRDRLPRDRFRASALMPDTASDIATALVYSSGSPARGFIVPVWRGVEIIVDPYTLAKKRQRILTATMFVGFVDADTGAHKRIEFKVA